jgi:ribosomal protein S18 acetylase RimI-like enzyme
MLSFAVLSKVQKSGVGTMLLNTILKKFKARGITAIKFGTVEVTNEVANAIYRRIGCELVRTVPFYNDSQVNVYVYNIP